MEITRVHSFSIEELACVVTGLDYDEIDADHDIIEEKLSQEFDISFESFHELIERLLPLIEVQKSDLTKTLYKGFGKDGLWLVKTEVNLRQ